jgi:hypothetical protein
MRFMVAPVFSTPGGQVVNLIVRRPVDQVARVITVFWNRESPAVLDRAGWLLAGRVHAWEGGGEALPSVRNPASTAMDKPLEGKQGGPDEGIHQVAAVAPILEAGPVMAGEGEDNYVSLIEKND